jgi:hypothetical protein
MFHCRMIRLPKKIGHVLRSSSSSLIGTCKDNSKGLPAYYGSILLFSTIFWIALGYHTIIISLSYSVDKQQRIQQQCEQDETRYIYLYRSCQSIELLIMITLRRAFVLLRSHIEDSLLLVWPR